MSAAVDAELISSPSLVPRVQDLPPLTIKQQNFIRHYLDPSNYRNGTQAAIKAGYSDDPIVASSIGTENLRKPAIQAHIQHIIKARHISPDEVLAELSDIALLPRNDLQSASNPDSPYNTNHKLKALELAGKHAQLWDKSPESSSDTDAKEVISLFRELIERARTAQVQPLSLPSSVTDTP